MTTRAHDDSFIFRRQGLRQGVRQGLRQSVCTHRRARRLVGLAAAASAIAAAGIVGTGPVAVGQVDLAEAAAASAASTATGAAQVALADAARPLVISEFRVRGPNGANDEFIEITNVSSVDHVVSAVSGTGYGVAASDGTTRCSIPNGTLVPAFASYLCVNSVGYSLASYPAGNGTTATGDATYTTNIPDNAGIALFNNNVGGGSYAFSTRLDAVGSTSEPNTLYKEGTGYPALTPFSIDYSFYRNLSTSSITSTTLDTPTPGVPKDTDNNAADLVFVDSNGTSAGAGQRLGAPGPSNLSSPRTNGQLTVSLLDPCVGAMSPPNAVRDFTSDPSNNSTFGTVDLRRTITNHTGAPVTRLRLRVADVRTFPAPSGIADMRPRTSTATVVTVDRAPCGSGTSNPTVQGTTLEQPPSQPNGGGFNSSLSVGTVNLATPLAPGASVDVRLLTGLQQTGSGAIRVIAEALTSGGGDNTPHEGECLPAPSGGGDICVFSNTSTISIPDSGPASPYPSTINVNLPDDDRVVTDVNVRLDSFSHTFPSDVDVMLVAPDGTTSSVVLSDTGGSTDVTGVNLVLDDEAGSAVPNPIVGGRFRPSDPAGTTDAFPAPAPPIEDSATLTGFDGVRAEGAWSLYVVDDAGGDDGVFFGWALELETGPPTCDGFPATIVGTNGGEAINGTSGHDVIVGLGGADTINAGAGNDRICGGGGNDLIRDQAGTDRVFGQGGADILAQAAAVDPSDRLDGGSGVDEASYATRGSSVTLTINNGLADDGSAGETDRLVDIEDLVGGAAGDDITGSSAANTLEGRGGHDTVRDLVGPDTVLGGTGNDVVVAPFSAVDPGDVYEGGHGIDMVSYASRAEVLEISLNGLADDGAAGEGDNLVTVEQVTGGSAGDIIVGDKHPNRLVGGAGDDTIRDLGDADKVQGGLGNDTFLQTAAIDAGDQLDGGAGFDHVSYGTRATAVTVTLANSAADDGAAGEDDALVQVEGATGGAGADDLVGTSGVNSLLGSGGDDEIRDGGGPDDVAGGGGDDTFVQSSAEDADDRFDGGAGIDAISYALRTDPVDVTLATGVNDDGGAGENDGLVGIESVFGGAAKDFLFGSAQPNVLLGGGGNDWLKGFAGADQLSGNLGDDTLHTLDGVRGNDVADGGAGTDSATTDAGDIRLSIP